MNVLNVLQLELVRGSLYLAIPSEPAVLGWDPRGGPPTPVVFSAPGGLLTNAHKAH
jgi:hypothetical protein